ncbi:hypothetical protein HDU87_004144 [Geranomyces variabilis]|uniref:Smr domain-containing protein n=1 Tax=Geranomyces variabilis TaxID=109894 RepID=A0AAD5XR40_9FUNG|nr:hypothetical protein HDU87_004144 [Geranomyces variabilis]
MSNQGYAPVSTPRKLKSKAGRAAVANAPNLTIESLFPTTRAPQPPSSLSFLQSMLQNLNPSILEAALSHVDGNVERAVDHILATHSDFDDASSSVSSGTEISSSCATGDDEVYEPSSSSGSNSPIRTTTSSVNGMSDGLAHDDGTAILTAMFPLLSHKTIEDALRTNGNKVDRAADVLAQSSLGGGSARHDNDVALATLIDIFPDHDIGALSRELARWDNVDSAIAALARPSPPPAFSCDGICMADGFPCIVHAREARGGARTPKASAKHSIRIPTAAANSPRSVTVLVAGRGASISAARRAGDTSSTLQQQEAGESAIQPRLSTLARPDDDPQRLREFAEEARRNRNDHYRRAATAFRKGDLTGRASAAFYAEEGREISKEVERWNNMAASAVIQRNAALHQHDPYTIDLHDLTVSEAVRYVDEAVNDWYSRDGASSRPRQPLKIIAGAGRHSKHGIRKVYPAVMRRLKEGGWTTKPGGQGHFFVVNR